ncbi:MAG TPA: alpha/beta hydrolase [Candidatus Sulfotelmatobacter sp.]|nr:alpha/beta hydrolase [Candidatus Sulfotelmatobacter sp.]
MELGTQFLKREFAIAFTRRDVQDARRHLDSFCVRSLMSEVNITEIVQEKFRGNWFSDWNAETRVTALYLHGGGYSFYPMGYAHFIKLIMRAVKSRTFALDYPLSPEHRFPAQLNSALNAYRWLLENETSSDHLIVAGDSAGGNLALALLLAARDAKMPLPALTIALSPATDFDGEYPSIVTNQGFDWIDKQMLQQWKDWFCEPTEYRNPLVSPVWADLSGLPPIYIQAGRAEILYDSIQVFAARAREQGVDIIFDSWEDMNHDFQIFGPALAQSTEALRRLGEVVELRVRRPKHTEIFSTADR